MFIIRKQHMEACSGVALKNYQDRVLGHLREAFPEQVKSMGDAQTREAIQEGVRRARRHSLITERDTVLYIEVMFLLGQDFESDLKYPWASEILKGTDNGVLAARAERLHAKASEVSRATGG